MDMPVILHPWAINPLQLPYQQIQQNAIKQAELANAMRHQRAMELSQQMLRQMQMQHYMQQAAIQNAANQSADSEANYINPPSGQPVGPDAAAATTSRDAYFKAHPSEQPGPPTPAYGGRTDLVAAMREQAIREKIAHDQANEAKPNRLSPEMLQYQLDKHDFERDRDRISGELDKLKTSTPLFGLGSMDDFTKVQFPDEASPMKDASGNPMKYGRFNPSIVGGAPTAADAGTHFIAKGPNGEAVTGKFEDWQKATGNLSKYKDLQSQLSGLKSPVPPGGMSTQGPSMDEATLRAKADQAIKNGADPEAVQKRLQQQLQILKGATSQVSDDTGTQYAYQPNASTPPQDDVDTDEQDDDETA